MAWSTVTFRPQRFRSTSTVSLGSQTSTAPISTASTQSMQPACHVMSIRHTSLRSLLTPQTTISTQPATCIHSVCCYIDCWRTRCHSRGQRKRRSRTATWIASQTGDPLDLLRRMKFETVGFHPVDGCALNVVEQINQTWTYTVALAATKQLLDLHPDSGGFRLAPGASASQALDIMSLAEGLVGAETFAAVDPRNNRKLMRISTSLRIAWSGTATYSSCRHYFRAASAFQNWNATAFTSGRSMCEIGTGLSADSTPPNPRVACLKLVISQARSGRLVRTTDPAVTTCATASARSLAHARCYSAALTLPGDGKPCTYASAPSKVYGCCLLLAKLLVRAVHTTKSTRRPRPQSAIFAIASW